MAEEIFKKWRPYLKKGTRNQELEEGNQLRRWLCLNWSHVPNVAISDCHIERAKTADFTGTMKTKKDPRHEERVSAMKALYQKIMSPSFKVTPNSTADQVLTNVGKIDKLIAKNASAWPIEQIAPVDLATLRLSVWELLYKEKKEPYKAVVDEAVEIAKEFGSDASSKFVNGVLGTIIKSKLKI